jgi:hypothetical protein
VAAFAADADHVEAGKPPTKSTNSSVGSQLTKCFVAGTSSRIGIRPLAHCWSSAEIPNHRFWSGQLSMTFRQSSMPFSRPRTSSIAFAIRGVRSEAEYRTPFSLAAWSKPASGAAGREPSRRTRGRLCRLAPRRRTHPSGCRQRGHAGPCSPAAPGEFPSQPWDRPDRVISGRRADRCRCAAGKEGSRWRWRNSRSRARAKSARSGPNAPGHLLHDMDERGVALALSDLRRVGLHLEPDMCN